MKKLFSYLLISSMVVLSSCTNYDDQFDDLNTQINTLKSQIEGFSSLSSGLTSLQGTVASLQSAIANIPVTPATDISGLESTQATLTAALTSLAADVKALQDTLATAATAAEVAALQTALTKAQTDLTELLAQNAIYTGDITINSAASLTVAEALGDKVKIVNGNVYITQSSTAIDATKLQAVVDKMITVTGAVSYTHSGAGVTAVNFNELTGAGSLMLSQKADMSLPKLVSVGALELVSDAKVTSISLPLLSSVTSFNNGTAANKIGGTKVTSIDLSSLASYDAAVLEITGSSLSAGYDLMLSKLVNTSTLGVTQTAWDLDIIGAAKKLDLPLMTKGNIAANDTKVIDLPLFEGTFQAADTNNHVTVTLGKSKSNYNGGAKLETVNITGILESTASTATGPDYDFTASTNLTTATIAGEAGTIDFEGASSLTSATVSADNVSVSFVDNDDLSSITLSGSTSSVVVDNAGELETLDLAHTTALATADKGATLKIINNTQLTSVKADKVTKVDKLDILNNDELTSVSFDAITAGTGAPTIQIGGTVSTVETDSGSAATPTVGSTTNNKLHAQSITQGEATVATATVPSASTGSISTDSGLADLAAFIVASKAISGAKIFVAFDQVDKYIDTTNASDLEITYATTAASNANTGVAGSSIVTLANVYPSTAIADDDATFAKRSWVVSKTGTVSITANGVAIRAAGALTGPAAVSVNEILSEAALAKAVAANVTLSAAVGGNPTGIVTILDAADSAVGQRYATTDTLSSSTAVTFGVSDTLTMTFGGQSVTITKTTGNAATGSSALIANALKTAWEAKYPAAGATSLWTIATAAVTSPNGTKITATSRDAGNANHNVAARLSFTTASKSLSSFDFINGATRSTGDDKTLGPDVIITLTAKTAGSILSEIGNPAATMAETVRSAYVTGTELTSSLRAIAGTATATVNDLYPTESRNLVTFAEEGVAAAACASCAAKTDVSKFNTTNWTWGS